MKKFMLILMLILFVIAGGARNTGNGKFFKKTKHKTVKKMKKRRVRQAQEGKTFYFRNKGKLKRRK